MSTRVTTTRVATMEIALGIAAKTLLESAPREFRFSAATLDALREDCRRLLEATANDDDWVLTKVARANLTKLMDGRLTAEQYLAATGGR